MSGLPLLFKKEGLIERHQVEGIDPSDRYFNRAVLVNRVAAGYTGKMTYEAYAVEGTPHSTTSAAVKAVMTCPLRRFASACTVATCASPRRWQPLVELTALECCLYRRSSASGYAAPIDASPFLADRDGLPAGTVPHLRLERRVHPLVSLALLQSSSCLRRPGHPGAFLGVSILFAASAQRVHH